MGKPRGDQEQLFSAANENRLEGLLPKKDPMVIFRDVIYPLIKDADFADLYSENGRRRHGCRRAAWPRRA